ncbi:RNA-binding domain-containing protein [Serendipita vermifera]|nr:RNA-binding domain-containing protein [Serendipita vermifera]
MSEAATTQTKAEEGQQADFKQEGTPEKTILQEPGEPEEEEQASETLYIQNLNDKVKLSYMKTTLNNLFRHYGKVVDVVAHRNLRMRGQAFVSFLSTDLARKAMKEVNKFPLYGKPMQITFAKTRSEAVVKTLSPAEFEAFHVERIKQKKRSRWDNPVRKKLKMKKDALATGVMPDTGAAGPRRPTVQMPDEYLPPNKILFVQNLPQDITKEALMLLFSPFENFYEIRMIPQKKDIAFVEYADEGSATVAKDALHNSKLGEGKIKVCDYHKRNFVLNNNFSI